MVQHTICRLLRCTIVICSIVGTSVLAKAYTIQQEHNFYTDDDGGTYDILPMGAVRAPCCYEQSVVRSLLTISRLRFPRMR